MIAGILICVAIAAVAYALGQLVPIVGGPVFGILIGFAMRLVRPLGERFEPGLRFVGKTLLQISIVLLGAHVSLHEIARGGLASLPVMLSTLVIVLVLAFIVGRWLGLDRDLRRLLGMGTAICGGSAIAALSSVIEAEQADVAYALGAVFLFNVVAVIVFPPLGHIMHLSQAAFGLWAGTAINDTSSVVAAAFSYGADAGAQSVIVKLTRTMLIVPIVVFYAWRRMSVLRAEGRGVEWTSIVPWFILWFLAAATLNSFGVIPASAQALIANVALFCIIVALAGVGLSTDVKKIRNAGLRPLALGAILWIAIATSSLAIARVLGTTP